MRVWEDGQESKGSRESGHKKRAEEDMVDAREVVWLSFNPSLSSSRLYLVQVHCDLFTRRKSKHGIVVLVPHNA